MAAISYDSPAVLTDFAARKGIAFPLIADPGSKIIRAFGILNEAVPRDTQFYGIPRPGTFLVDASGTVTARYFEDDYRERYTAGDILVRRFGAQAGAARSSVAARHVRLTLGSSNGAARWGQRIALVVEGELGPRMHVYAPGVQGGYIPVEWNMAESPAWKSHPVELPPSRNLHLPVIGETVPVYEGHFRMARDITIGPDARVRPLLDASGELTISGTLRYQACDDKVCYTPETVPLQWKIRIEAPDTQRAQPGAVRIETDPRSGETTYSASAGACRIAWLVSGNEPAVVRQHADCGLPLPAQVPLLSGLAGKVFDAAGAARFRRLSWGRLYPDGQRDTTMSARLALAARRSPLWDAALGRPRTGDMNATVRKLANEAAIYAELRDLFRGAGLTIELASIEKVLVARADQLPFLHNLAGIGPADNLPFDCITWFAISPAGPR